MTKTVRTKKWMVSMLGWSLAGLVLTGCGSGDVQEFVPVDEQFKQAQESRVETAESEVVTATDADKQEGEEGKEKPEEEIEPGSLSSTPPEQGPAPIVPEGMTHVVLNNNVPTFENDELTSTEAWATYGELDEWYRVTPANAVLGVELMPSEKRGSISSVIPTGWKQQKYDIVSAGWLYNRSHLIGFQLTGENANEKNLMTGTRWFNVDGMLPFENFVANYIEQTENHVRYRVTPHFEGDNLLASGLYMEGFSIEDNGEGLMFNVYVPNSQPGVGLDYATGESWLLDGTVSSVPEKKPAPAPEKEPAPAPEIAPAPDNASVSYKNCSEVRAAGKSPIKVGDPGFEKKFDRDGDGVGCE